MRPHILLCAFAGCAFIAVGGALMFRGDVSSSVVALCMGAAVGLVGVVAGLEDTDA